MSPLRGSICTYVMISVLKSIHYLSLAASRSIPRTGAGSPQEHVGRPVLNGRTLGHHGCKHILLLRGGMRVLWGLVTLSWLRGQALVRSSLSSLSLVLVTLNFLRLVEPLLQIFNIGC